MDAIDEELVRTEIVGAVAILTLDSPANRNALSTTLVAQLTDALQRAGRTPDVRAVLVTHTGNTFCAGADLGEALSRGSTVAEASELATESMLRLIRMILELPKPVVARIDGHVRAGGLGVIGACDMVFAGPSSTFAFTEARLGLAPSVISVILLPKMTARSSARYYLTGERFDARTAQAIGLITESADSTTDLEATVAAVLGGIGKASPTGLAASKALTTRQPLTDLEHSGRRRAEESAVLFGTDDARDAMKAFLAKRPPPWDLTERRAP